MVCAVCACAAHVGGWCASRLCVCDGIMEPYFHVNARAGLALVWRPRCVLLLVRRLASSHRTLVTVHSRTVDTPTQWHKHTHAGLLIAVHIRDFPDANSCANLPEHTGHATTVSVNHTPAVIC